MEKRQLRALPETSDCDDSSYRNHTYKLAASQLRPKPCNMPEYEDVKCFSPKSHPRSVDADRDLALGLVNLSAVIISSKVTSLGRGSIASHNSGVPIKVLGNLLERRVFGFDEKLPHNYKLKGDKADIDQIVFPADISEGDGVDILVEPQGNVDEEEHDGETL